ncbi:MAG: radical SAM protein [Candidatus Hodarchaeales archaeon]
MNKELDNIVHSKESDNMKITEIECKSFINRMDDTFFAMRHLPFRYTSNPYRGCSHGCVYCYAARTHYYLQLSPDLFSKNIYAKTNCAEVLDKELQKLERKGIKSVLIIGNVSDAYQPIETKYHLTRQILKTCLKYHYPCFIETKSPLILEDLDLLEKLGKQGLIGVGMTVTSYDERFARLIEPCIPRKKYLGPCNSLGYSRLLILEKLASVEVDTYLHITPYFPFITEKDIEQIIRDASKAKVKGVIAAPLELTHSIRDRLATVLNDTRYAYLIPLYDDLYFKKGRKLGGRVTVSEQSHFEIEQKISELCGKYNVPYWAFTNLQFNSTKITGIYKWGYPILINYYDLIKKNGKVSLTDATLLAKNFQVDNKYLRALQKYWVNGELFKGIHGVKRVIEGGEIIYTIVSEE